MGREWGGPVEEESTNRRSVAACQLAGVDETEGSVCQQLMRNYVLSAIVLYNVFSGFQQRNTIKDNALLLCSVNSTSSTSL